MVMDAGYGLPAGVIAGLLCGAFFGAANGIAVGVLRIPPFVATLGMMGHCPRLCPDHHRRHSHLQSGGGLRGSRPGPRVGGGAGADARDARALCDRALRAAPHPARPLHLRHRQQISRATKVSGVNVPLYLILIYGLSGITAAIAGLTEASRIGSGQPAGGIGYELDSIAAVVIGGTSLFGGQGNLIASLIGALIIATLRNGLNVLGVYRLLAARGHRCYFDRRRLHR